MVDLLKTFFSKEMKMKIDEYLFKMKSTKFLSELNLDLNSNDISLKSYSIHYLENLKSIWLEVANLSVNLYVEYEFFRQFSFPNRYKSQIYEERLKKLGYKRHKGIWKIDQIPNEQCIIENIFYSYIYMFLCKEKKIELDNEKFINENARNSLKLKKLCNPIRKNINVNNTINEEITYGNIDHSVPPIIGEMGNNDIEVLDPYRDKESILNTPINASNNATCSNLNSTLQKSEMISEKEISSSNSKIKSNLSSSQCSYNKNNGCKINCEVCLSSKFAKINSCVFESSSEASNENRIEHDANNADNKDKWTCKQCTFNNRISVDLCEICFTSNKYKIGTINDYELPEETWCCKACGENNLFECYKCKNCRLPAEFFNKWRCERCSYYNDKIAIRCRACEIENPYLKKSNVYNRTLVYKTFDKIFKESTMWSGLPNGYRSSEKLNEMKSNEDIQQNLGSKDKIPAVESKNKINSNPCKNCKFKVCANNQYWCVKCKNSQWYCQNESCDVINYQNEYCKQCTAKKGSDFSDCTNFWVIKDKKEVQMWQCGFCLQFNAETLNKCPICDELRYIYLIT